MKTKLTLLCVLALMGVMLISPASAGNLGSVVKGSWSPQPSLSASNICAGSAYCNGEVNGNLNAWTINFGYSVSNSFTLGSAGTVTKVSYGVWNFPGDSGGSVSWNILTGGPDVSAGGTVIASGNATGLATMDLGLNNYGYDIQVDSFNLSKGLSAGTYFLELSNAAVTSGDPVYWDENNGPLGNGSGSIAWESAVGYLTSNQCGLSSGYCSESFAVYTSSTVPEPGTLGLLGSGLLGAIGVMRRKLMR
jgi:hypothetical protein